ncbi:MAG: FAD binding domain-containing protein [Gammaproteobacteria bacterium]|nr:FAD binding domain-containing protein [Gammaproteobacteria bacterium]MDH3428642.1 FAD binding domain-containing protein [Gammaproteobacteria bacterium]MDH3433115.1 FAD binding domain-containing protein [Gammaproteobacteria bacterium]
MTNTSTNSWNHYYTPKTVTEAVELLRRYDGRARVIGGGTDLAVEIRRGLHRPVEAMVDATRIAGLDKISRETDYIVIGCGVTHSQIVRSELIIRYGTCLSESCSVIGGPQVRNVGTLAGNVAHALPAGDGTIGLLALGGEIEVAGTDGTRWLPVENSFRGPGKSFIDRNREVLTRLRFRPTAEREGSAHHRVMRPQGLCLPIISLAVRLRLGDDNTISHARISMGPVGPVPYLVEAAMDALLGKPASEDAFVNAAEIALQSVSLRASKYRASHEYREEMLRTYLPRTLQRAAQRATAAGGHDS